MEQTSRRTCFLDLLYLIFNYNHLLIRNALVEESPDYADSATAAEIEALKVQIAALSEKVNIPSATKTEVYALQERLNQLRVGISNEIKKDREQLASLTLAISRLESQIEQLIPSLNLQVDGEGNEPISLFP
ncbi:MAG: hypothetical protein V7K41_23725 [Nostoc sp.]|uniref:hypothetical protein n=1 Tax=Nostoc sp. TaxID=1180 RepID=UPI002FFB38E5